MLLIKQAWGLGKGFFLDKAQRRKAYYMLIGSVAMELAFVYMSILMNKWNNEFFSALQELNISAFYSCVRFFVLLLSTFLFVAVARYLFQANLALRWRQWLTAQYYSKWGSNNACYGANLLGTANDNPDQRISEDLNSFVKTTILLSFGIFNSFLSLISFSVILWTLSGPLKFTLFNIDFVIHGYLVWVALIYSIICTIITYGIGRRLSGLDYLQEKKEANFRFLMMRFRENAESVALYNGEEYEKKTFKNAVGEIVQNTIAIIKVSKNLTLWNVLVVNVSNFLPIFISAPLLFAKKVMLGGLMQIAQAFNVVQEAFSFLVTSFASIASYRAVVTRLTEFNHNIEHWNEVSQNSQIKIYEMPGNDLVVKDLTILSPTDKMLLQRLNFSLSPGKSYLFTGRNGSGKSSLVRAMGGIWVFGAGDIIFPKDKVRFFIPQNVYMPMGTLAQIIAYPSCEEYEESYITRLMQEANIGYLAERMKGEENWSSSLSMGEKQKIGVLRAIVHKPDILIMDESSSAMTEEDEKLVYDLMRRELPSAIIVSVGHRHSLKSLHDQEIVLG